ncbi:hypothetical protein BGX24_011054, partial [Mortierella sp. AD032]
MADQTIVNIAEVCIDMTLVPTATERGAIDSDLIVPHLQVGPPQETTALLQQQQQQQPLGATSEGSDTGVEGSLHSYNSGTGQPFDDIDTATIMAPHFSPTGQRWDIPAEGIPQGSYELVLGISSLDLKLETVDSISFDIIYGANQTSDRSSEVISSSSLRDLFDAPTTAAASDNATIAINNDNSTTTASVSDGPTTSVVEHSAAAADAEDPTTVANAECSTTDPDVAELVAAANTNEPAISIDRDTSSNHTTVSTKSFLRWKLHERIAVVAESDSGSSNRTIKVIMTVETWKGVSPTPGAIALHVLELHQGSCQSYKEDPTIKRHFPFTWFIDINGDTSSPKEIASYCFSASWELSSNKTIEYDISVSWDGSQIVVLDLTNRDQSAIYIRQKHRSKSPAGTLDPTDSQQEFYIGLLHSKIRKYFSKGTFHTSASSGKPLEYERFVTFDGKTMAVYSVCDKWKLISEGAIVDSEETIDLYPDWKDNLREYRLVLLNRDEGYISTRDLRALCRPISARDLPTTTPSEDIVATCLSECGKYFVMATRDRIDLYLAETWTTLGCWSLQKDGDMQGDISGVHFITKSRRVSGIVVNTHSTLSPTIDSRGFVVDIDTLTTLGRIHSRSLRRLSLAKHDTPDVSTSMFLYESPTTLGAIQYTDRLVRPCSKAATMCTVECGSVGTFQTLSDAECPAEVVECVDGSRGRRKTVSVLKVIMQDANLVHVNTMEIPLSKGSKLLGLHQSVLHGYSYMVVALSSLILVWRTSASSKGNYDLLWAEGTNAVAGWTLCDIEHTLVLAEGADIVVLPEGTDVVVLSEVTNDKTEWRLCKHRQLHRRDNASDISTRNLLDLHISNPDAFLDGIVRLVEIFKDADEMTKCAIIRYTERHINQCLDPENDSVEILTHLCASWSAGFHEHLLAFIRALFGSPSFRWVPKPTMNQESNPILILIGRLKDNLYVLDIVEVMINYCIHLVKVDSDLHFLGPITQSLRIALEFQGVDSGVFARILRSFAYFPAREYNFAVDHHAVADPPFDSNKKKMLHECKDPVLELSAKPIVVQINKRLTPRLYVASLDMLWSYEEIPISKKKHWAFIQQALLFLTFTSKKRCVCHPFELEDLDNPAIVALVRYKWMKIGFPFWLLHTLFHGYVVAFFIIWNFFDIYVSDPISWEVLTTLNKILSVMFLLDALRDLVVLTAILKMKPRRSFRNLVDTLLTLVSTSTYLAGSSMVESLIGTTIFVSRYENCRRLLVGVAANISLNLVCNDDDECSNIKTRPENFFIAATRTYFMTGGIYDLVEESIEGRSWKVHLMLVSFLFVVTIMLNILFGMVNHAFDSDGRIPELEWIEERMYIITRADNCFRGLRQLLRRSRALKYIGVLEYFGISEYTSEKKPDKIYYTAAPQKVRKYKLETYRLHEEAATAAIPLEVTGAGTRRRDQPQHSPPHPQQQQKLENWAEQLKGDIKAEFKEEWKEQLEAQKKLLDEQSKQLVTRLDQRNEKLEAYISRLLAA